MKQETRSYLLDLMREELLDLLGVGCRFAEIGVAKGEFSQEIVNRCQPSALTLIDPWSYQESPGYELDRNNVDDETQEERYRSVCKRLEGDNVSVLRETSLKAVNRFQDASLDFIYIDAMHTFDAVKADLDAWWPKLADDGLLMGHDYANHITARKMGFDVVPAVNKFVEQSGCAFVGITHETYPSYILARSWQGRAARILEQARILCSFDVNRMNWELLPFADGTFKAFPRL